MSDTDNKVGHPINHWTKTGSWPKEYFRQDPTSLLPKEERSFASLQGENSE